VVINLVPGQLDPMIAAEMERLGLKADALIPEDEVLNRFDLEQKPLLHMPDESSAVRAVDGLMEKILSQSGLGFKK
jgi:CO dehydrogenase maturation factor